ncbi:hypothetical protein GCM10023194_07720 [Planotetraspora phitsanulokensis]|uniref:Uncharacterized protein n=1 Tax=Planotetraspora phitsanulokensis TaxID=575192 RepID=A0A8J3U5Z6_9ACTN|nr:hypothetical protein [Planotetraspora phitsanulokensis]GII39268.1 hypothetical protein Pph01_42710 [Planotetraspora phitsanulokensis]
MSIVDQECVRRLIESADPNVALVFVRGECVIRSLDEIEREIEEAAAGGAKPRRTLVIVRREDIPGVLSGQPVTEERLASLTHCLDNIARDLGA